MRPVKQGGKWVAFPHAAVDTSKVRLAVSLVLIVPGWIGVLWGIFNIPGIYLRLTDMQHGIAEWVIL